MSSLFAKMHTASFGFGGHKKPDQAFSEAEADPETKAIILETTGKAFVAGADIKFFIDCINEDRLEDNYAFTVFGQDVLNRIDDSRKLVVAKMDGLALEGGFELALSTDIRTPCLIDEGCSVINNLKKNRKKRKFIAFLIEHLYYA